MGVRTIATISEMLVKIGAETDDFKQGLSEAQKETQSFSGKFKDMSKNVAKGAAVFGGAVLAAGAAVGGAMVKYGNYADEMLDLSAITGMSTDEIQRWRQVAVDAGVDLNQVTSSMQTLNKQLERGNEVSPRLAKGFDTMNTSAEEFKQMNPDEQMRNMIGTMMELEGADRRAFANQMNMADVLPMVAELESQGKDLDTIMNEIDVPFDEDSLNTMNEFRKTWDNLKQQIFEVIGKALLPLFDWVSNNLPQIKAFFTDMFETIRPYIETFIEGIRGIIETVKEWFSSNEETMTGIKETIQTVFGEIVAFLQEIFASIQAYWQEYGEQILENFKTIFNSIKDTVEVVFQAIWNIIQQIIGLVVPFIKEQLARIQQFWDENGEQIMQAVQNAFSIIQGIIETVMPIVTAIIEGAWNIIKAVFNAAVGIVMGIVKTLASLLTGDFQGIKDGLTQIWESLWDGIKGIVSGAWGMLSGAFSGLWSSVSDWFTGLKDDALSWGKDLIQGFINGITGMAGTLKSKVSSFINDNVPGPIKSILGIASPSKLMEDYGGFTAEGLEVGINDGTKGIEQASENMADASIPDIQGLNVNQNYEPDSSDDSVDNGRIIDLLQRIVDKNSSIVLDTGQLVGATRNQYDQANGEHASLAGRWGR